MALKASDLGERKYKCMACDSQKNDVFLGEGTDTERLDVCLSNSRCVLYVAPRRCGFVRRSK